MVKTWILSALGGFILGGAALYGVATYQDSQARAALLSQNAKLQEELDKARKARDENKFRMDAVEQANRQLAEKLQSSSGITAGETPEAPAETPAPTPPQRDRAAEMKAFGEKMMKQELERWQGKLKLRPDQVARIQQLLQLRLQNAQPGNWDMKALQAELMQVLTPEQKADYEHIKDREAQARLELRTNTEMLQVQAMFDLNDSQKEQIFQKFAALEQSPDFSGGGRDARAAQNKKRVEALKDVLTADQLKEYSESLNSNNNGNRGRWGR